jgi:hypothetical protein
MREILYRWFETPLLHVSKRVAAWGIAPAALTVAGIVASLLALPMIAGQDYEIGLAMFLLGRMVITFAAAARDGGRRDDTPALLFVLDRVAYAGVPFAFALADPGRALASAFLLFGFIVAGAGSSATRGIHVTDAAICLVAYALACFLPDKFGLIAYALGIACFAVAGIRLAGSRM